jgi:starch synthase
MYALRYGALPVVARVGGLADTVIDSGDETIGTGVTFSPVTGDALAVALTRTLALWKDGVRWRKVQARAMATDVSWRHSAAQYAQLYRELVPE